ncbi:hypothetical protein EVAR_13763_1 [Eumeta japonica]|uniref:Uncharacterized protein n=1 Tax=Eumeta variegata TaxID=151549 RepID=A0A4C1U1D4_EUMVA|nr:hypothetical protein EVAR_13763_1 [Eumeta japonica]
MTELNVGVPVFVDVSKNADVYQLTIFNQNQTVVVPVEEVEPSEKHEPPQQILKVESEVRRGEQEEKRKERKREEEAE